MNNLSQSTLLIMEDTQLHSFILSNGIEVLGDCGMAQKFYLELLKQKPYREHSIELVEEKILKHYEEEIWQECVKKSLTIGKAKLKPYYFNNLGEVEDIFSTVFSSLANGHVRVTQRICEGEFGGELSFKDRYDTLYHAWGIIHFKDRDEKEEKRKQGVLHVLFNFGQGLSNEREQERPDERWKFYIDTIVQSQRSENRNNIIDLIFNQLIVQELQWKAQDDFFDKILYTFLVAGRVDILDSIEDKNFSVARRIENIKHSFVQQNLVPKFHEKAIAWLEIKRQKKALEMGLVLKSESATVLKI